MRRRFVLGALAALLVLSIVITAAQAPQAGPSTEALAATKIGKVKDNLYVITGSTADMPDAFSGGNTAVFITAAGVVLVDTKLPGWGQPILDLVKTVTDKPVVRVINTHTHGDHTGSNEFFGAMVDSVVHENTKTNMARMDEFKDDKVQFLPKRIFQSKATLGAGRDQIDLYYFGAAHTNGDAFVVFPALRTVHVGDVFPWKALPFIDVSNGGSALAHPETLSKAVKSIRNVDTVINGHIPLSTWNELKEYVEFSKDFVKFGRNALKAGKTVDQAAAEYKIPARFKGYTVSVNEQFVNATTNLQVLYDELKRQNRR